MIKPYARAKKNRMPSLHTSQGKTSSDKSRPSSLVKSAGDFNIDKCGIGLLVEKESAITGAWVEKSLGYFGEKLPRIIKNLFPIQF